MEYLWILQLAVVLGAIYFGIRLGSIGIGYAGGVGVLILCVLLGMEAGNIPIEVILIIASVISAISAMQVAGGLDYMVSIAERILRKHPKHITYLAPTVTYFLTILAGTGHTAFAVLPVIIEVAKEQGIRPSRPLSIAVVASQIAITASPISAAMVFAIGAFEGLGIGYLTILAICIPTTYIACMIAAFFCNFMGKELKDDPVYQERLAKGLVTLRGETQFVLKPYAKLSVGLFLIGIVIIVFYAAAISDQLKWIAEPPLKRDHAIIALMLSIGAFITVFAKIEAGEVLNSSVFKSGMSACICVLGVAWLGDTFVSGHLEGIKAFASELLQKYPWMLAIVFYFASMLLYSQAATAKTILPAAIALGVSPLNAVASLAAISGLFVLPTYPTTVAAIEMDDTGSTRIGRFVINHPFIIPGTLAIALSVAFGFLWGSVLL